MFALLLKVGYLRACCDSENYYEAEDATVTVTAGDDGGFSSFCVQTTDDDSSEQEEISIDCGTDSVIESLFFACYGNPSGSCSGDPFYYHGTKHLCSSEQTFYCGLNLMSLSYIQVAVRRIRFRPSMTA